ncbi:hypothetical protein FMEAI12_6340004 [Parafrankia sp. Ea1.12]|nr:hypothetical protein FMEAI12_6340004 [Parafrankia sp. Ea1.12]
MDLAFTINRRRVYRRPGGLCVRLIRITHCPVRLGEVGRCRAGWTSATRMEDARSVLVASLRPERDVAVIRIRRNIIDVRALGGRQAVLVMRRSAGDFTR